MELGAPLTTETIRVSGNPLGLPCGLWDVLGGKPFTWGSEDDQVEEWLEVWEEMSSSSRDDPNGCHVKDVRTGKIQYG